MRGPAVPVTRTTSGLCQVEGTTPKIAVGAYMQAGAAAEVVLHDGTVGGTVVGGLSLAAAGKTPMGFFGAMGFVTGAGVYVEIVSGTPTVVVYVE